MEAMRQSWTDDRLDDLSDQLRGDIAELRKDNRVILAELGAVQRTMIQFGGGLIAANLTLVAAVIGLVIAKV
jgi:hypothetical protein